MVETRTTTTVKSLVELDKKETTVTTETGTCEYGGKCGSLEAALDTVNKATSATYLSIVTYKYSTTNPTLFSTTTGKKLSVARSIRIE